jgi:mRNA interferase HigB
MHVIAKMAFMEAARKFPQDRKALLEIYRLLKSGKFKTPDELKALFPSLDNFKYLSHGYVIDVGGNNLRILAVIYFDGQKLFVRHIVTHKEYDKLCDRYRKGEL